MTDGEAGVAVDALAASAAPWLIGVRHHSPALASVVPELLDGFQPQRLLVELPEEMQPWLHWLGHPGLTAPVALAAARVDGTGLAFYPFADFSPELAAVRWARGAGVPVEAIDLPVGAAGWEEHEPGTGRDGAGLTDALLRATGSAGVDDLWDRLVESHAPGSSAEAVRRAGLAVGWLLRQDAGTSTGGVPASDVRREAWMATRVAAAVATGDRVAVLVGAFHGPALVAGAEEGPVPSGALAEVVTSLVPYDFDLLDSRSGYPAGIRDPAWQQRAWAAAGDAGALAAAAAGVITAVATEVRRQGHPAGVPDSREALRLAEDLARLRGLPSPGRRELVEGIQSAFVQGEPLGRGRVVARAMDRAMVGRRRGVLAPGTERSGLAVHVEAMVAELGLPGPSAGSEEVDMRLDPFRSPLDRRRHLALRRLEACRVPYGRMVSGAGAAPEALTFRWWMRWVPSTSALLELAGVRGVTLAQAAEGALRARAHEAGADGGDVPAALELLETAAECGLAAAVDDAVEALAGHGPADGTLVQDLAGADLLERVAAGLVPGTQPEPGTAARLLDLAGQLLDAALRQVDGLAGSTALQDARALAALVLRLSAAAAGDGQRVRLGWSLDRLAVDGTPLIQGVAEVARVLLGRVEATAAGATVGSWVDVGSTHDGQAVLTGRLRGVLVAAAPVLEASPDLLDGLVARVEAVDDDGFLRRLPALRGGFEVLSTAGRGRFFAAVCERLGADPTGLDAVDHDPLRLARWAAADLAGREAVARFDPTLLGAGPGGAGREEEEEAPRPERARDAARVIGPVDRWRLILGHQRDRMSPGCCRVGAALDELYGRGGGEGSRRDLAGAGGGSEAPFPSVREWADELEALLGVTVREEVLAAAAGRGRLDVALALDPERVEPSVDLLLHVLSLKGGLSEAHLGRLRRLVAAVVDELVRRLATRARPALTGAVGNRPTRRPGGPLDLRRTVAANLATVRYPGGPGRPQLVPEQLVFRTRTRRSLDWRVILVVDVSGSMEASVVHAALMAAIVAGLPAVTVHFVAFSTEVVDLSDRVDDPLGLLLEVSVGGGTRIAAGLRHARSLVTVPARTVVVLVTDFEEGGPVADLLAEVRALAEAGTHPIGLAALDEAATPRYSVAVAQQVVDAGMPVAALTPLELARWIGERLA